MAEKNYSSKNTLTYLLTLLKGKFDKKVDKEHKTGSESDYKVLSDNNLTDELLKKINDAGSSSFNGSFNNLTDIPTLDGTELKGALTKEGLGLAGKEDIPTDNADLTNGAGYQTASDVEGILEGKKYQTEEQVEITITEKGYQTASDVEQTISSKKYQTEEQVEATITEKGYQTASDVEGIVNAKVASAYKYKGSVPNYDALTEKEDTAETGDVWNTEDTEQNYGWTGEKWDPLGATFDTKKFVQTTDLVEITNEEIDAMMADW